MKRMIGWMVVMVALAWTGCAWAADVYELGLEARANTRATHLVVLTHADLTETTTNTAQTLTTVLPVLAKQGVELVAAILKTPFTDDATNAFNSVTLKVGDGTDDDLYLTSTELNSYGTEIFLKFPPVDAITVTATTTSLTNATAITATTSVMSNVVYNSGATTGNLTYVSAVTLSKTPTAVVTAATAANGALGRKVYTADDTVDFIFTPSPVNYALSALDNGEVWLYFHITDAR